MNKESGFTLLELLVSISILVVLSGVMFSFSAAMGTATQVQEAKVEASDEVRQAMQFIVRDIRQAGSASINWGALPGNTLQYQVAEDLDGNGVAVDANADLELGPLRTIGMDTQDANNDGIANQQLIWSSNGAVRVLCSELSGQADSVWFEQIGGAVRVTVETRSGAAGQTTTPARMAAVVVPRN